MSTLKAQRRGLLVTLGVIAFGVVQFLLGYWMGRMTTDERLATVPTISDGGPDLSRFVPVYSSGDRLFLAENAWNLALNTSSAPGVVDSTGSTPGKTPSALPVKIVRRDELKAIPVNHKSVSPELTITKKVILRRGDTPNLQQLALGQFPVNSVVEFHTHRDMSETFHVLRGRAVFEFVDSSDNRLTQTHVVHAGDTVSIPPGVSHSIRIEPTGDDRDSTEMLYFAVTT